MVDIIQKDIERISFDILKDSGALDKFPTSVEDIVKQANLKVEQQVNLHTVDQEFFASLTHEEASSFKESIGKVRGILDREHKRIYLDFSQLVSRQKFIQLHEVGHELLNWQGETLCYLDDDQTLHPDIEAQFEHEANYFASITLFQHDRFFHEIEKYEFGIDATLKVKDHFGASLHATLRRYVEFSHRRCALLVLKDITPKGAPALCYFRDSFQSPEFTRAFGKIPWPTSFGYKWPFVPMYYHNRKYSLNNEITLDLVGEKNTFSFEYFNNSYNAFILIFPKGEQNVASRITNPDAEVITE